MDAPEATNTAGSVKTLNSAAKTPGAPIWAASR